MKKFIHLTRPTGHVYEIPTEVIASHRAATMLGLNTGEFKDLAEATADTAELFTEYDFSIQDWAQNNMNWSDLQRDARLVRFTPPAEDAWHAGDWSYHDTPALMGDLDGATIMKQPVELVMTTMALHNQLCNATVLHGPDGQPYGAFVMILGAPSVLHSYMTALKFVGDQVTGQPSPEATH